MTVDGSLTALRLYLEIGVVVALALLFLVGRLDHGARGAYWFRPLLLPAAALLWPWVAIRLLRAFLPGVKS